MQTAIQPFYGLALADGALLEISAYARMLTILDIAGADAVSVRLPGQSFVRLKQNLAYELPQGQGFGSLTLRNDEGAAITSMDIILSEGRIYDNRSQASLLTDILAELDGTNNSLAYVPQVTVTTTATKILSAATGPRKIILQQKHNGSSGDYVYIGSDNTVAANNFMYEMQPGASIQIDNHSGELWGITTTGTEYIGGKTE